jgi:predicted membrane-bound dolichyl-phosphate-mannose-protein mannosyltransferase
MTTQLSTKLAALALALSVNVIMMGGVALLFSADAHASQIQALAVTASAPARTQAV